MVELIGGVEVAYRKDAQRSLDEVDQQVAKRDEVISPARRQKIHGVDASPRHVALKPVAFSHLNVLAVRIHEVCAEAEVN